MKKLTEKFEEVLGKRTYAMANGSRTTLNELIQAVKERDREIIEIKGKIGAKGQSLTKGYVLRRMKETL